MTNLTGSITATGRTGTFAARVATRETQSANFNVFLNGTVVASIQLEKSYDQGTTWNQICGGGTLYQWSYNTVNLAEVAEECEQSVIYCLNCTNYTSGTITCRLSRGL